MTDLAGKRVMVTGGGGFLGGYVVSRLEQAGAVVFVPELPDYDLRYSYDLERAFDKGNPQLVVHLAAKVGGIGANQKQPAEFFYDNAMMGIQLIDYAYRFGVEKLLAVASACCYPKHCPLPFNEDSLWDGYPEETNAAYAMAKKMLIVQSQAYRQQYGFNSVVLLPANLYGTRDHFNLETSHVIPALIRKFTEAAAAEDKAVTVWGDGSATREFLYVDDCAAGIVRALQHYDGADPVNLGSGHEIPIGSLAALIAHHCHFLGQIVWDKSKPNGQPLRKLDSSRAKAFGFEAVTDFEAGLRNTIEWYRASR